MQEPLYHERLRPQFHFSGRQNWLNDPNGLVFYKGVYHLFFQHNPSGIQWGNMTWGHAVSPDMVHWKQLENALEPDELGTMYSGCGLVDWKNTSGLQSGDEKPLVFFYTAAGGTSPGSQGQPYTQCLAYSLDGGLTLQKYAGNPVIPHIAGENRDPKVTWYEPGQAWVMTLYLTDHRFCFLKSTDLVHWTPLHEIDVPDCIECPDFFEIPVDGDANDRKWVWIAGNGHYLVGEFDGQRFTPQVGPLVGDHGANFYAVQTYSDVPDGRRIQVAWMAGGKYPGMPFNQQMSFPCELKLKRTPQGLCLTRTPVAEIERLHAGRTAFSNMVVSPGLDPLSAVSVDLLDIHGNFDLHEADEFCLTIRGEKICYSMKDRTLTCLGRVIPLELKAQQLDLRILVDRASIEVFASQGMVSASSCFTPEADNHRMSLQAFGGYFWINSLEIYELDSSWQTAP